MIHGVLDLGYEIPLALIRTPNSALTKNERTPHPRGIAALSVGLSEERTTPQEWSPHPSAPRSGCQPIKVLPLCWHALRGATSYRSEFPRYRFARPGANGYYASGIDPAP